MCDASNGDVTRGRTNKEQIMNLFKKFAADESGATAIEYGLIAALVAVVIIGGLALISPALEGTFCEIGNSLTARQNTGNTACPD